MENTAQECAPNETALSKQPDNDTNVQQNLTVSVFIRQNGTV